MHWLVTFRGVAVALHLALAILASPQGTARGIRSQMTDARQPPAKQSVSYWPRNPGLASQQP